MLHDITNTLLFIAGILFVIAGAINLYLAVTSRRTQRDDITVVERALRDTMKQLMSFHKAGIMLANSEAQFAQAEADNKRAEADRLLAETNLLHAQRRETEANTDVDAIPKPTAPPKFGDKGRHRVGETAYTEEAAQVRTR